MPLYAFPLQKWATFGIIQVNTYQQQSKISQGAPKINPKLTTTSILFLILSAISFILKATLKTTISPTGILQEPFFLIPLGYLFLAIGLILGTIALLRKQH